MKLTNLLNLLKITNAKAFFSKVAMAGLVVGGALLATPANAQMGFEFQFGHGDVGLYAPAPGYYAPAPAYYAPAPEYYATQPVYQAPAYGYYRNDEHERHEGWERERRDFDRRNAYRQNYNRQEWDRRDFDRREWDRHDFDRREHEHRDDHRERDRR